MKKGLKIKWLTMLLAISMILTVTNSLSATGETENTDSTKLTDKIFRTTVVAQDNGGVSTYALNSEPTYTVNLALTDSAEEIEEFTITDTDGQSMESQISNTNDSVQISGLALDELYVFNSTVDGTPIRGAVETVQDGDTVVAVTDVYDFSELESVANGNGASPRYITSVNTYAESPDTTSAAQPQSILRNYIIIGSVHGASDYDFYKFTAVHTGYVDFKVLVPDDANINLTMKIYLYNPTTGSSTIKGISANSGTGDEYRRVYATAGDIYRIEIEAVSGSSGNYYLHVENNPAKAWFPQSKGVIGTTYYWNTNKLELLTFNGGIQFTDNAGGGSDAMASGCALTSASMILANMGVKTSAIKYDFRISYYDIYGLKYYTNYLTPDPYVVFLANNNLDGDEIECMYSDNDEDGYIQQDEYSYSIIGSGHTIGANNWETTIAEPFGKSVVKYESFTKTQSGFEGKLEEVYQTYPSCADYGVLVYMESEEIKFENTPEEEIVLHTHFIVVTKEYGEYKVYDPGQISYYNIDLDSYMGSTYDFEDIVWFRVFY